MHLSFIDDDNYKASRKDFSHQNIGRKIIEKQITEYLHYDW